MKAKWILTVVVLLVIAGNADAQTINARARHERHRVVHGVRKGEITRPEAYRLHKEKRHIRRDIHRARKNDGRIGPRERKYIRHQQRKHSRHIYRAKHNRRDRRF